MTNETVIFLVIAVVAIAAAAWMFLMLSRTRRLRSRFGPEYDRTVEREHGRVRRAETLLENREKRVSKLNIRPLTTDERERFTSEWRRVQERFVDDPRAAVSDADTVVSDTMQARNYPMSEFEQRIDDISVEYPHMVEDYRIAHRIATSDRDVTTEDLRKAMQHYRNLFEELVQTPVTHREEVHR